MDVIAYVPQGVVLAVVAVFGLLMGSFLNCLAWRMTHGESVLRGRSHCTSCGHVLGPLDLVPVVSWLLSHGRCRYCGERVSARYPATEVACALIFVSIVWRYGLTLEAAELVAFACTLFVLSLTDLDTYIIPDSTIVVGALIRLAYVGVSASLEGASVVGALGSCLLSGVVVCVPVLVLTLLMDRALGKESLGGGDVKLFAVCGMYFGWQQCLFLIVVACVIGILVGTVSQRLGHSAADDCETSGQLIAFGPSIAAASWVTMLSGSVVVAWYLSLFSL